VAKKEANIIIRLRDRASSGFRKLSGAVGSVLRPIGLVTGALGGLVSLAGGAFLASAIRNTGGFGEQLSILQGITQASAEEMAALEAAAREAGATTRFSATEAAQGIEELARSGQNASEAIATLNPVLDLAAGNNQTVAESAIQVTTALNAFGLAADQAGRVSDVYTRTAQRSAQTTAQLGEAMTFVAPVARQAGLEIEETAALIGRLADAGFRGSLGGTALRNAILQFQDPASNFRAELEKIGITSDDFITALSQMAGAGGDAEAAIRSLGLRAGPAIQAIVAGGAPALQQLTEELNNAGGASEEAAKALEDNLPGAFRNLQSAFSELQIALTQPLTEEIKKGVFDLADVIRNFAASDTLATLRDVLVETFRAGREAVVQFVQGIDFTAARERFAGFIESVRSGLATFRAQTAGFQSLFGQIIGGIKVFVGALGTVFNATGVVISKALEVATGAISKFAAVLDFFSLGTIKALGTIKEEAALFQQSIADSTAAFERKVGASVNRMVEGWQALTVTAQQGAASVESATTRAGAAVDSGLNEPVERVNDNLGEMQRALLESGLSLEQIGLDATQAGAEVETASNRASEAVGGIGDAAEESAAKMVIVEGAAGSLEIVAGEAEATSAAFDGLSASIERAGTQTQLDALASQVQNLAAEGELTEQEVRALIAAINEQASAMQAAAASTDGNTRSIQDLGSAASQTAGDLDQLGRQARGASRGARNLVQDMGNAINIWREAGPEATARVEDFVRQWNRIGLFTFEGARNRINRFVEGMEREFGPAQQAIEDYNRELRETDNRTRGLSDNTRRLGQDIGSLGGAEIVQRIIVEFRRDQGDQVVLSENQMNRIADFVLERIERDQERAG